MKPKILIVEDDERIAALILTATILTHLASSNDTDRLFSRDDLPLTLDKVRGKLCQADPPFNFLITSWETTTEKGAQVVNDLRERCSNAIVIAYVHPDVDLQTIAHVTAPDRIITKPCTPLGMAAIIRGVLQERAQSVAA